jgi:HD-GYP domain-containing protein (c-di-GMP phosphodiesterase class II)
MHGEDIPIVARIVAVADVFDALVSERPYKHAWTIEDGFAYLLSQKGKHFDASVIDAFLAHTDRVREIQGQYTDK